MKYVSELALTHAVHLTTVHLEACQVSKGLMDTEKNEMKNLLYQNAAPTNEVVKS